MSKKITCIITDDEPFAAKGLQNYVERTGILQLEGVLEDAMQLGEMLLYKKPDLLFLDIEMPHITGLELLRSLKNPPKVIFTTAYEQYALQGYELDVLDYLLKPISYDRFFKAVMKAADYFALKQDNSGQPDYLFVKAEGKLEKIAFDELLFAEGMENYLAIYTTEKRIITHSTLKAFLEKLPAGRFIQTHKSYIVALSQVQTVSGNILHIGKHQVPVGRSVRDEVIAKVTKSKW